MLEDAVEVASVAGVAVMFFAVACALAVAVTFAVAVAAVAAVAAAAAPSVVGVVPLEVEVADAIV